MTEVFKYLFEIHLKSIFNKIGNRKPKIKINKLLIKNPVLQVLFLFF